MDNQKSIDYNLIASTYACHRNASKLVINHILEQIPSFLKGNILEAGCGTADHLSVLDKLVDVQSYGFDLSTGMIREGFAKNPGLYLACCNANFALPYPAETFDFVFSVNVIHYIRNLDHYFNEMHRILKPGGIVLTATDSEDDLRRRTMATYFPQTVEVDLKRYHRTTVLNSTMTRNGFDKIMNSHAERVFQVDDNYLAKCKNKAFSAIRLLTVEDFEMGLRRLKAAIKTGNSPGREVYTFFWGFK